MRVGERAARRPACQTAMVGEGGEGEREAKDGGKPPSPQAGWEGREKGVGKKQQTHGQEGGRAFGVGCRGAN